MSLVPASYLVYALALLGAVTLVRRRELSRPPLTFYSIPLLLLLSSVMLAGGLRYRVPLDPLLLAFAGLGAIALASRVAVYVRPRLLIDA